MPLYVRVDAPTGTPVPLLCPCPHLRLAFDDALATVADVANVPAAVVDVVDVIERDAIVDAIAFVFCFIAALVVALSYALALVAAFAAPDIASVLDLSARVLAEF